VFGIFVFLYIFEHLRMPRYLYVIGFISSRHTRRNKVNLIHQRNKVLSDIKKKIVKYNFITFSATFCDFFITSYRVLYKLYT